MNRRHLLRVLSATGAGALAAGLGIFNPAEASPTLFIVTNDVRDDLMRMSQIIGVRNFDRRQIEATAIQPASQDLSLIMDGRLVDPSTGTHTPALLKEFASELRRRSVPGQYLVSITPRRQVSNNQIVIERDGVVIDELSLETDYRRIEVSGATGKTVLALRDGHMAVTHASCRHGLCKKVGRQSAGHIVCAPNRLVVRMPSAPSILDAISG